MAGVSGFVLGALHGWLCGLPRVNDIATGIGLMIFGTGLAFFLGKPFVQPKAPTLPSIPSLHITRTRSSARRCMTVIANR